MACNQCQILLKESYKLLREASEKYGLKIPQNVPLVKDGDLIKRNLDCAVIESIHAFNKKEKLDEFDSVRGVFFEGSDLYPDAGFKEKNHIQIAIRNPNCIKGYFIPRERDFSYRKP